MGKSRRGIHKMKRTHFTARNTLTQKKQGKYRRVVARSPDGTIVLEGQKKKQERQTPGRPICRFSMTEFKKIVKKGKRSPFSIPAADGSEGSAILLRPRKEHQVTDTTPSSKTDEDNILVERHKLMDVINKAIGEHSQGNCKDINLDLVSIVPWGHYSKVKVACKNCSYVTSDHYKLYSEAERKGPGPKEARGNLRLQYLLQEMPIGNEKVRLILAALGIRPGSRSGMQVNANKVSKATIKLNEEDMGRWAEEVKTVLQARGVKNPHHVSVAMDGRYDGASLKSWATPGRGATAATGVMVEKVTEDQKVIGIVHYNKTCVLGSRLRGQGKPAQCGVGQDSHPGCTADMPYYEDISERQMGHDMSKTLLNNHGIQISHVTTDGDALASQGIADAYKEAGVDIEITRFSDLTHRGACQRKRLMKMDFAATSFGMNRYGKPWLSQERTKCKQALANDIELRSALTLRQIFTHYDHNIEKVQRNVHKVVEYMMRCYNGDHSKCKSTILAKLAGCSGRADKTWFHSSAHLSGQGISAFNFSASDAKKIQEVIELKLSAANIPCMSQLLTTQKVESVNHAINVSDPKNFHYCRNAKGRNHSAIHRVNNGPDRSIHLKLQHGGCSLPPNSNAAKTIRGYGKKLEYSKQYKRQEHVVLRRRQLRSNKIADYYRNAWRKNNHSDYLKHQLEDARLSRSELEPGTSTSTVAAARQAVKKAKKQLKAHQKKLQKRKLAANMKRKRTWNRNKAQHIANRRDRQNQRLRHYSMGSQQSQHVKCEHAYSSWKRV